ncbi:NAD-dependent epimerase/dehydratase family protein [Streptomyces sp. 7N604]|uniref:NAD-dependent epimerase/dehydratase family protein n=1 Tax=Streptomyces sp. 7N604 TaxID=3457415 RepID=UPI003FD438EE
MPLIEAAAPALTGLRRVVVTGSAGFIGSHLTKALLHTGVTVIGIDRRTMDSDPAAAANFAEFTGFPNFVPITADLLDCPMERLLLDADVVFHLAALPGVRPSWGPNFDAYVAANIQAVQRVMNAATRLKIPRVVLASSSSVYGPTDGSPSAETDRPRPASPYAITKLAAEQLCLAHTARPSSATSVVALRYFTVYGPRQRTDMLIHRALTAALYQTPLHLFGDDDQRRDFTYVADAVRATIRAATAPVTNTVINIGVGSNRSISDILAIAQQLTGRPVPVIRSKARAGDVPGTLADNSRAGGLLSWKPEVDLTTGTEQQLHHLRTHRDTHDPAMPVPGVSP